MQNIREKIIPMQAPTWAGTGHLQTLIGHFLPSPRFTDAGERIEIEGKGGDRLVSFFFKGGSRVSVYLFHGLGGYSHSTYMQRTARLARRQGHSVYLFNHRGCGDGHRLAREPYHSGRAEDLSALIAYGKRLQPENFHLAIGFSLSGNALLLLAAGERAEVLPDAAVAVNAPIDLGRTAELLGAGFNRVYDLEFLRESRKAMRSRAHLQKELGEIRVPWRARLRDVDDLFTAPFGGFKDRHDYYKTCSAKRYLAGLKIPTVLLTAKDDPFVDYRDYSEAAARGLPARSVVHIEEQGGHMGYLSARPTPLGTRRWLDHALDVYIREIPAGR